MLLTWFAASTRERIFVPSATGKLTLTTLSAAGLKKMKTKSPRNERTRMSAYGWLERTAPTRKSEKSVRRRSDAMSDVRIRNRSMKGPETALIRISETYRKTRTRPAIIGSLLLAATRRTARILRKPSPSREETRLAMRRRKSRLTAPGSGSGAPRVDDLSTEDS